MTTTFLEIGFSSLVCRPRARGKAVRLLSPTNHECPTINLDMHANPLQLGRSIRLLRRPVSLWHLSCCQDVLSLQRLPTLLQGLLLARLLTTQRRPNDGSEATLIRTSQS